MTILKNFNINAPRAGSTAKACTEISTPERTKKVPSKLNEKTHTAKKTVQVLQALRFSVIANEWISAVPANQGRKAAFTVDDVVQKLDALFRHLKFPDSAN